MNWDRVNVWTNTLYTLIHSIYIAKQIDFGNLTQIPNSIVTAGSWTVPPCSYDSILANRPFGKNSPTFRRDPNKHFPEITEQIVKMLIQDLTVILDEMMTEALIAHQLAAGPFPQSKIQKLATRLQPQYDWSRQGCLELVAVRNVLTHANGHWNAKAIAIVSPFLASAPKAGDPLKVGFQMLFQYRKAMRTFLNETSK